MTRIAAVTMATTLLVVLALAVNASPPVMPLTDKQIARFEGTWLGHDNPSPFGPISFAMDFRWEEDGSLHSRSAMSHETWVDLRLRKDTNDLWVLDESASLAGLGVQEYTLHPVSVAGDTLEWAHLKSPWYLTVRTAVSADELYMLVLLRGKEHVQFRLQRVEGDEALAVRAEMDAARQRTGQDDVALLKHAGASGETGGADDPVEIRNARARVKAEPGDASAHLQLAEALAEIIETAPPAKVPGYAMEMLGGFRKAVELEPTSTEAHFGLAQYYLNAPPIAGGSLDEAAREAAVLGELESPLGEVVLAQIEAKRGQTEPALTRIRRVVDQNPDLEIARQVHASLTASRK